MTAIKKIIKSIIILLSIGIIFSCKEKKHPTKQKNKLENNTKLTINKDLYSKYHYIVQNGVLLYGDKKMDYTSEEIDTLDFLEPVEIIKKHKDLNHSFTNSGSKDKKLNGFVCRIKTLNNKKGYIFSEHLKTYGELSRLINLQGLDEKSISKNGKFSKPKALLRLFNRFDQTSSKPYYYTTANRLSLRKNPSLDAELITVLKYLEPIVIIKNLQHKKEIIDDSELGEIRGNWCRVKLLNGKEGYIFNGYIAPFEQLSEQLNPKGIVPEELLINGKLKTTTALSRFLDVMGKPDSVKYYTVVKDDFSQKIKREHKNGIVYISQNVPYEENLDLFGSSWIYDDVKTRHYYKNGIEYEELNGEVSFSSIDFKNNNYIMYNGFRIDSATTLNTIIKLFPIQSIHKSWRYNDHPSKLYEFGTVREKNNGSEIYWQLYCDQKASSFNVYWYD